MSAGTFSALRVPDDSRQSLHGLIEGRLGEPAVADEQAGRACVVGKCVLVERLDEDSYRACLRTGDRRSQVRSNLENDMMPCGDTANTVFRKQLLEQLDDEVAARAIYASHTSEMAIELAPVHEAREGELVETGHLKHAVRQLQ